MRGETLRTALILLLITRAIAPHILRLLMMPAPASATEHLVEEAELGGCAREEEGQG